MKVDILSILKEKSKDLFLDYKIISVPTLLINNKGKIKKIPLWDKHTKDISTIDELKEYWDKKIDSQNNKKQLITGISIICDKNIMAIDVDEKHLEKFNSIFTNDDINNLYVEKSISGKGLHIIAKYDDDIARKCKVLSDIFEIKYNFETITIYPSRSSNHFCEIVYNNRLDNEIKDSFREKINNLYEEQVLNIKKEYSKKNNNVNLTIQDYEIISNIYSYAYQQKLLSGYDIEKVISACLVKSNIDIETSKQIFKNIYQDEYDENRTQYILSRTSEKEIDISFGSLVFQLQEINRKDNIDENIKNLVKTILKKFRSQNELPEIELIKDDLIRIGNKGYIYEDRNSGYIHFIKVKIDKNGVEQYYYDNINLGYIVDFVRLLKDEKRKYVEYKISAKFLKDAVFRTTEEHIDDDNLITEIYKQTHRGIKDKSIYKLYLIEKIDKLYREIKSVDIIAKRTGWSKNLNDFYYPSTHEFDTDHILIREFRDKTLFGNNKDKNLLFLKKELESGNLLSVLLLTSLSTILIEPLNLKPITLMLLGNSNAGKTTAALLATSLFYPSYDILLTTNNTKVALELTMKSLSDLPILIDEGAIKGTLNLEEMVFMISSGKGRGRGTKNLKVNVSDIRSNVFYTSETTDIVELRRTGAFKRILVFTIEKFSDLTKNIDTKQAYQILQSNGAGLYFIDFLKQNIASIKDEFEKEKTNFKYYDLVYIESLLKAGLILIEKYFNKRFDNLRQKIDEVLKQSYETFITKQTSKVDELIEKIYALSTQHFFIKKEDTILIPPKSEMYGLLDYNKIHITKKGLEEISKQIGVETSILIKELKVKNMLEKNKRYVNRIYITKSLKPYCYTILLDNDNDDDNDDKNQPPEPTKPPEPTQPDDDFYDYFDTPIKNDTTNNITNEPTLETKNNITNELTDELTLDNENNIPDKPIIDTNIEKTSNFRAVAIVDKKNKKITIDENKLAIFVIKNKDKIKPIQIKEKKIKNFNELVVASFDIETTTLDPNDDDAKVLAILVKLYKDNQELESKLYTIDSYQSEQDMIVDFLKYLYETKFDILTGYNILNFDLPYIYERLKKSKSYGDKTDKFFRLDRENEKAIFQAQQSDGSLMKRYKVFIKDKEIKIVDTFALVLKYDNVARELEEHNLKYVAKHFKISKEDRAILNHIEIKNAFYNNRELFMNYFENDVFENYQVFRKLYPRYYQLIKILPFKLDLDECYSISTAAIWNKLISYHYDIEYVKSIEPDKKMNYEGGLVINNQGFYENVFKIDVASLYPNIMLNYHVCSVKDTDMIQLSYLKEFTKLRLELKKRAKQGDVEADLTQEALKILINSGYGYLGTSDYTFNDMVAAAGVTAYGRAILRYMIDFIQKKGATIIECDTDGVFFSSENGEQIYNELKQELNKINFDIELEIKNAKMLASDKKNYVLYLENEIKTKGSKWRGRDNNKLTKEWAIEYAKTLYENKEKAQEMKREMREKIQSMKAFDELAITKKVGKNDKFLMQAGFEIGEKVRFCYLDKKNSKISLGEKYDIKHYLAEFEKLCKEIENIVLK